MADETEDEQLPEWLTGQPGGPRSVDSPAVNPAMGADEDEENARPSIGALIANGGNQLPPGMSPDFGVSENYGQKSGPTYGNINPKTGAQDSADAAPAVNFKLDPSAMPAGLLPNTQTPDSIPAPPTGSDNPNLSALAKQQAGLATPINPYDAAGKTKPQYRMGTGQRILGTVGNFLGNFGGKGQPTTYVGPGATNWRFGREEAARQGQLAGVNTQIKTQQGLDTENERIYRDATRSAAAGQVAEARKATAAAQQQNADTKQSLEASQAAKNDADAELKRTKAGQPPPEPKTEVELSLALQTAKQTGDKAAMARYQGALDELKRQKAAGKDTSAGDIAKALGVAEYRGKEHDRINQQMESERKSRVEEFQKSKAGQLDFDGKKTAAFNAQLGQELQGKYASKHQSVDDDADKMLGLTKSGTSLKTNKSAPAKIDPANLPKTVQVKQKDGTTKTRNVQGYNKQTKKLILAPE